MNVIQRHQKSLCSRLKSRRGAIAVLTAVMLIAFLASVAFSVDIAYMQLTRTKLRSATDAAARAAGEGLSRVQDVEFARQAAKDIALANYVAGEPLILDDSDVVFGRSEQEYNGSWQFTPGEEPFNAVRVFGRRTREAPSGSVSTFFGRVFNVLDFEPEQQATVVRLDRDLCLVVDRSSSMKLFVNESGGFMSTGDSRFCQPPDMTQSRWWALSNAVQTFVDALVTTPQLENVALVSYGSAPMGGYCGTWSASTVNAPLSEDHTLITGAMSSLSGSTFNGGTDIAAGILAGIAVLTGDDARPFAAKTMVLMTDGHYSTGTTQPSLVAPQAVAADILIHTVTFSDAANQAEMQAVATATGGNHYHAPDAATLQAVFEEIALTLPVVFTD